MNELKMLNIRNRTASFSVVFLMALILPLSVLVPNSGQAQQDPMFAHYYFNPLSTNPAYAGTRGSLSVNALAREQWVGIEGRPRTQTLSAHSPLKGEQIALGFSIVNDQAGPLNSNSVYVSGAYKLRLSRDLQLSLGLNGGANLVQANLASVDGSSETDPVFLSNISNKLNPNFGAGAYLYSEKFFAGISAPKLLEHEITGSENIVGFKESRHFFASTGIVLEMSPILKLKPTIITRYVTGAPVSIDANLQLLLNDRLWIGGMYRSNAAAGVIASFIISQQFRIGYTYEQPLSWINNYSQGSHELFIGFDFDFQKDNMLSPRYF